MKKQLVTRFKEIIVETNVKVVKNTFDLMPYNSFVHLYVKKQITDLVFLKYFSCGVLKIDKTHWLLLVWVHREVWHMKILKVTREQLVQATCNGWLQAEELYIQKCLQPKVPKRASNYGSIYLPRTKCKNHPSYAFFLYFYDSGMQGPTPCILMAHTQVISCNISFKLKRPPSDNVKFYWHIINIASCWVF